MGASPNTPTRRLPLGALGVNMLGTVLLALGIVGLVLPEQAQQIPALADRTTAWSLIGIGLVLEFWSALALVGHLRSR